MVTDAEEDLGNQPIWSDTNQNIYVMKESHRARYWKLPPDINVNLATLATWYKTSNTSVQVAEADKTMIDGVQKYTVLSDRKTVLQRRSKQAVLLQSSSGNDDLARKLLFK